MIERKSLPAAERAKITQALRHLVQREVLSVLSWNTKKSGFFSKGRVCSTLAVRTQEVFGEKSSPMIAKRSKP